MLHDRALPYCTCGSDVTYTGHCNLMVRRAAGPALPRRRLAGRAHASAAGRPRAAPGPQAGPQREARGARGHARPDRAGARIETTNKIDGVLSPVPRRLIELCFYLYEGALAVFAARPKHAEQASIR